MPSLIAEPERGPSAPEGEGRACEAHLARRKEMNPKKEKPKRRPYVKVSSSSRSSLSSIGERIDSDKDLAYTLLVAEWSLCLACITFF